MYNPKDIIPIPKPVISTDSKIGCGFRTIQSCSLNLSCCSKCTVIQPSVFEIKRKQQQHEQKTVNSQMSYGVFDKCHVRNLNLCIVRLRYILKRTLIPLIVFISISYSSYLTPCFIYTLLAILQIWYEIQHKTCLLFHKDQHNGMLSYADIISVIVQLNMVVFVLSLVKVSYCINNQKHTCSDNLVL